MTFIELMEDCDLYTGVGAADVDEPPPALLVEEEGRLCSVRRKSKPYEFAAIMIMVTQLVTSCVFYQSPGGHTS